MKVPFYNPRHPEQSYENNNYTWVDLKLFLDVLDEKTIKDFEDLSAFELDKVYNWMYDEKIKKYSPVSINWDLFVDFKKFLIASKVFYTTGFTCKYGYWKKWELTDYGYPHHGIDLILPKWTPIVSFSDGKVVRIKKWDWKKHDEWNCIVIQDKNLFFCYEHLETINVSLNDSVRKWQIIWTCGKTWNASTYHLHFQIDNDKAPFHPYWWKWEQDLKKTKSYCIDPWNWLRENYLPNDKVVDNNKSDNNENDDLSEKNDLVDSLVNAIKNDSKNYIDFFINSWILKWDKWNYLLDKPLKRYHLILILYRLYKKWIIKLAEKKCDINFSDIDKLKSDIEFMNALEFVYCNHIVKWDKNKLYPWINITGITFLAIIWRLFANLKDWDKIWYKPYLEWAEKENIISKNWYWKFKAIPRNEVFKILYNIIKSSYLT